MIATTLPIFTAENVAVPGQWWLPEQAMWLLEWRHWIGRRKM